MSINKSSEGQFDNVFPESKGSNILAQPHKALEPLTILTGADNGYAMPLAITLFTALIHLKPEHKVEVYIMDGGINEENHARIERVLKQIPVDLCLHWVKLNTKVVDSLPIPPLAYHSVVTNFRLFAPQLVLGSKVIYLDSDVIVLKDLSKLWSFDLKGHAIAATRDLHSPQLSINIHNWGEQNLDPELPYFNAGVLLMDLDKWRQKDVSGCLINNLQDYRHVYMMNDQDALNAILQNDWIDFGARWNAQINDAVFRARPAPISELGIIHYTMDFKPWKWLGLGLLWPYYQQFLYEVKRSDWFSSSEYLKFLARLTVAFATMLPKRIIRRGTSWWRTKY